MKTAPPPSWDINLNAQHGDEMEICEEDQFAGNGSREAWFGAEGRWQREGKAEVKRMWNLMCRRRHPNGATPGPIPAEA
jgi:hypothetical protein